MEIRPWPTTAQWARLEAYILSIPALASLPHWPRDDPDPAHQQENYHTLEIIRDYLNSTSTGFYVWKESVSLDTIYANGLDWTLIDNLTVGKARIWEWLFHRGGSMGGGSINATKANVRAGIEECWKGTTAMLAQRAVILGHCKTTILTHAERGIAVGTGTAESPAVRECFGGVSTSDVEDNALKSWGW